MCTVKKIGYINTIISKYKTGHIDHTMRRYVDRLLDFWLKLQIYSHLNEQNILFIPIGMG